MKFKLIEKRKEVGNIHSFIFKPEIKFNWSPGQYLIYSLDNQKNDLRGKQRFFTISSSPFEELPKITTRIFSKNPSTFKRHLANLKIGDTINVKGPDGDFTVNNTKQNFVFIAQGIGITPFISIIKQLNFENKKINVVLLYSNKSTKEILFKKELEEIAKTHQEFKIKYLIKPQKIDTKVLKKYIANDITYYISGPDLMVENISNLLKELKVKEKNLQMDYFSGYKT